MSNENNSQVNAAQEKRLAKAKQAEKEKNAGLIYGLSVLALLALIIAGVVLSVINNYKAKKAEEERLAKLIPVVQDLSAGINSDGIIEVATNEEDYLKLNFDPNAEFVFTREDVVATEEEIQKKINDTLINNPVDGETRTELNTAFVKDVLKEDMTAEQYVEKLKNELETQKKNRFISNYISSNCDIYNAPDDYIFTRAGVRKFEDNSQAAAINQLYMQFGAEPVYNAGFELYEDMTEEEYEDYIMSDVAAEVMRDIAYQSVFKKLGLTITDEDYNNYLTENEVADPEVYGVGYIKQRLLQKKVNDHFIEVGIVPEDDTKSDSETTENSEQ